MLTATVVDHWASFLSWRHDGLEFQAWSNIDFHHLGGFSEFRKGDRHFHPIVLASRATSAERAAAGLPAIPAALTPGDPAFVLVKGDAENAAAIEMVSALHELYAAEGPRLRQAHEGREQRRQQLDAEASSQGPGDIVLRYWKIQANRRMGDAEGGAR